MKLSTLSFSLLAASVFPTLTIANHYEGDDGSLLDVYPDIGSITVNGVPVVGSERVRQLKKAKKSERNLQLIVDDCPDGESRFFFEMQLVAGTSTLAGFGIKDGCTGAMVGGGSWTSPIFNACLPDGITYEIVMYSDVEFGIDLRYVNDDVVIGSNWVGVDLPSSTNGEIFSSVTSASAINGIRAFNGQDPLLDTDFDPNFERFAARIEARIGEEDCPATLPDPHFKSFGEKWFDFHGGCDLILTGLPNFFGGFEVHIRTTVRYAYSFIETAALKIGSDTLQISGYGQYLLNGVSNADTNTVGGWSLNHTTISDQRHEFTVSFDGNRYLIVKTFKDMVSFKFHIPGSYSEYAGARGLMGDQKGNLLARDGVTIIQDANEFGNEWQVHDTDDAIFMTTREPQFPAKCIMPSPAEREQRRLEASISMEEAAEACAHIKKGHLRDMCIFDVVSTDDLSVASGAY